MLIAVLADTHIPRRAADLPATAWANLRGADAIVHAGDVMAAGLLERLAATKRLIAVRGNNVHLLDWLPEREEVELDGVRVGIVHDAGPVAGRRARLRRVFPFARVAVFGHSHVPLIEDDGSLLLLNPGSPTDRRRMPSYSMGMLSLHEGAVDGARIIDLGLERAARGVGSRLPNG